MELLELPSKLCEMKKSVSRFITRSDAGEIIDH